MTYDWREVWRKGLAPKLSTRELEVLRDGLAFDDPDICQGKTVSYFSDSDGRMAMRACAIGFAVWKGRGLQTSSQVYEAAHPIFRSLSKPLLPGSLLSDNPAAETFWKFFDEQPRQKAFAELLEEVGRELSRRRPEEVPVECGERQGVCA